MTHPTHSFADFCNLPKSRSEARDVGSSTYFSGVACKNGHISPRRTLNRECVFCHRAHAAKRGRTPEVREYLKNWVTVNGERTAIQHKLYRIRVREKLAPIREAKKMERLSLRAANKNARDEAKKAVERIYREKNFDKINARILKWRMENSDRYQMIKRSGAANRHARKIASGGRFTAKDVNRLKILQRYKCCYCGSSVKNKYHIDHIMPLALGGANSADNLQILCPTCNLKKGALHPVEYAQRTGRLI